MFSTLHTRIAHRVLALITGTGTAIQPGTKLVKVKRSFTLPLLFAITLLGGFYSTATIAATCSINPQNAVISEGNSINFSVNISGKWRGAKTYAWQFPGGSPPSSTSQAVTVSYATEGGYTVIFDGTSSKDGPVKCTTSVTVNAGGQCTYNPPTFSMDGDQTIAADGSAVYTLSVTNNDTAACADTTFSLAIDDESGDVTSFALPSSLSGTSVTLAPGDTDTTVTLTVTGNNTGADGDNLTSTVSTSDNINHAGQEQTDMVITTIAVAEGGVTARGDAYATPIGKSLSVAASRLSGVLYNDFGGTGLLTAVNLDDSATDGSVILSSDGSFDYTPPANAVDNQVDTFTYQAEDSLGELSAPATVAVQILSDQPDFKMTMNYELGMHCTGFEFAYCCVLPPYNSIVAQITKPQTAPNVGNGSDPNGSNGQADIFPRLLDATEDPATKDNLGRETVLRDLELDGAGNFKRYQVRYYHDAQPRADGNGKPQTSTLISDAEGETLLYHGTKVDSAAIGPDGQLNYGQYAGAAYGVWLGDGDYNDPTDNYANAWLNHFYIYSGLEGDNPNNSSQEADKIRLGVTGMVEYPKNVGASLQPLGPVGSGDPVVGGNVLPPFDNVLTFSTDTGTVVYTQMKVLENLPVMLTSPRIWEALGLPLTPFEDNIGFYLDPGSVSEENIRPYVAMKAALHDYPSGDAVIGSNGQPVIGFGTAPIDIPNCERCHSAPSINPETGQPNVNSPNYVNATTFNPATTPTGLGLEALTDLEYNFWLAYYNLMPSMGDSDWYPRLKAAAINMMALHDSENGTVFAANYPGCTGDGCGALPDPTFQAQNTRLGFESVICQKCHADNVIAVVKSGCKVDPTSTVLCPDGGPGTRQIIAPISEAIHWNHRGTDEGGVITFSDGLGRDGGCQGCHPAHRSDGVTDGYPITLDGDNFLADGDNRLALGGCFVGRDVHSNPMKDIDGAETPEYLNAVGQWLSDNVYNNQAGLVGGDADNRGIWCTNCHNQLGQSIWAAENMVDLVNNIPGKEADLVTDAVNIRALPTLAAIEAELGLDSGQAAIWLDPVDGTNDTTHSIWNPDVVANPDAAVALIEATGEPDGCNPNIAPNEFFLPRFGANACLSFDGDPGGAVDGAGDPSVRILDFCTTPDCETEANHFLANEGTCEDGVNAGVVCTTDGSSGADCAAGGGNDNCIGNSTGLSFAFAAPFDAATDGRDHWLAPGEPHCADCHASPFTEQSGNLNPFPPFNYPRKASLMRYSRGHQDLTCQSCHESIHGLYPVTPTIDSTSYAQAASLNPDGSHGPLKCATCHDVDNNGIPVWMSGVQYNGSRIRSFDDAVAWAHTFTDNVSVLQDGGVCENCHSDRSNKIAEDRGKWLRHSFFGRVGRQIQDKAEIEALGYVAGSPDTNGDGIPDRTALEILQSGVCSSCHSLNGGPSQGFLPLARCDNETWKLHLIQGRLAESVWEFISEDVNGSTCGW